MSALLTSCGCTYSVHAVFFLHENDRAFGREVLCFVSLPEVLSLHISKCLPVS